MDQTKPFSHLNEARGKTITVELKNDTSYTGVLESFDMHLNLVLDDAQKNNETTSTKILIRGDMIVSVSNL